MRLNWIGTINSVTDTLLFGAEVLICGVIAWNSKKLRSALKLYVLKWVGSAAFLTVLALGASHFTEVLPRGVPIDWIVNALRIISAILLLPPAALSIISIPTGRRLTYRGLCMIAKALRTDETDDVSNQMKALSGSQIMVEFNMDGTVLRENENYLRALNFTPADLEPKDPSLQGEAVWKKSTEYKEFWKGLKAGKFQAARVPITKGGREVWIEASYNPIIGLDGVPIKVVKLATDVTSQIRTQGEFRDTESRLQAILDNVQDGIITTDASGVIVSTNPAIERIFGYRADELAGQTIARLMPSIGKNVEDDKLSRTDVKGFSMTETVCREVRGTAKDGRMFPLELTISQVPFQNQQLFVGLVRDVTERKRVEAVSRQAKKAAEDSNRIKSDFLANMSHEVRTPMNAILGMTYLALRADPTPDQFNYLTKIDSAAQSLLKIVNDILDFSKIEAGKLELEHISFSLEEVLDSLKDIVSQEAEQKGLAVGFSIGAETPRFLKGDPVRLGQILINLVTNAVKFTATGEVTVSAAARRISSQSEELTISVRDTGIGIDANQIPNLFRSFSQADSSITRQYGGTGLGLAISKQLCDLMGGTLSVVSEPGVGSTFTFQAVFDVAHDEMASLARTKTSHLKKKSILVVDDTESGRDVLLAMLSANEIRSKQVSSGEAAIAELEGASAAGEPFDLVIMDWRMRGMDGIEASRRIRTSRTISRTPAILMVSAFERAQALSGTSDHVVDGFLTKPVSESILIDAMADILSNDAAVRKQGAGPKSTDGCKELMGRRVLLVEDNEINRDLATELLHDLGISVTKAMNGREAVEFVATDAFDWVLMDIQMPVMDGLTATKTIRADERFNNLPILAMTAAAMSGDRERSLYVGMNDHVTKPINPPKLRETLLRWIRPRTAEQVIQPTQMVPVLRETVDLPVELHPFDMQMALMRANGKSQLLRKILLSFRDQYENSASELRAQIDDGRLEIAERLVHSLKSAAATLGAKELTDAALCVELSLRKRQMENIEAHVSTFEKALQPAISALHSLNLGTRQARPTSEPTVSVSTDARRRPRILVVDDEPSNLQLLEETLGDDYEIFTATQGTTALEIAASITPDLILLDVLMPGTDGYEVCRRLKAEPQTSKTAVIFITGLGDVAAETKGLDMGAVDYITKPFTSAAVKARVKNQIRLKRAQDKLTQLAATDGLTGLANRRAFDQLIAYEYARHMRSGTELAVILLDIDHFKSFNDTYGHVCGDDCLQRVAQAIRTVIVRATDFVARYGGEEFVFLLPETDLHGATVIGEKIRKCIVDLAMPHSQSTAGKYVTASLGIVSGRCLPDRTTSDIIVQADGQLYAAKSAGRNRIAAAPIKGPSPMVVPGNLSSVVNAPAVATSDVASLIQ